MHRSFVLLPVARESIILQWRRVVLEDFKCPEPRALPALFFVHVSYC